MFKVGKNNILSTVRLSLLYFSAIFLCAFSSIPIKFFYDIRVFPNLASIFIFYFFIVKKQEVSYLTIFLFGLLFDVFNNFPIGATSLIWLISSKFITFLRQHFYKLDNFITVFREFAIFALVNVILQWILFSVLHRTYYPFYNSALQLILDLLFFAIFFKLLRKMEQFLI